MPFNMISTTTQEIRFKDTYQYQNIRSCRGSAVKKLKKRIKRFHLVEFHNIQGVFRTVLVLVFLALWRVENDVSVFFQPATCPVAP